MFGEGGRLLFIMKKYETRKYNLLAELRVLGLKSGDTHINI
jgi:hypothetical protein